MPRSIPTRSVSTVHPDRAASRMMRRRRSLASLVALALLGPAGGAWAQATKRCDLVGRDTVISGVTMKKCLDLASLRNQGVDVPSNITRIDNDGLSLCNNSVSFGGKADIAYVYDNSGSMNMNFAWIGEVDGLPGADTVFYHGTGGCPAGSDAGGANRNGTINVTVWNAAGTATTVRTGIVRLVSNTGCRDLSGDPYNARGRAYRLGLANQGSRAPQSGAGIMSFVGNASAVGNIGTIRLLPPANVTALQSTISAISDGGTNYRAPLDTAKRWLNSSASTNPKKAIIFLSDGVPNSINEQSWCDGPGPGNNDVCEYLSLVDANMPPIYGIFLGRDTVGTGKLRELSQRTNGQFFLIPPTRPDSLVAVVDRILDIVLLEFEPNAATVTNTTIGQTANSSAPAGFTLQPNGSWRMSLSDIVALNPGVTNNIRVTTQFRERNSGDLQNDTISFRINTTQPFATTSGIITTQFSRMCFDPSQLRLLNPNGSRPQAFTEATTDYRLRLRTAPISLSSTMAQATSRSLADAESPSLALDATNADSSVFALNSPFRVMTSRTNGNGTLESSLFDSVFAVWTHPRDAQDVARDSLVVRAANVGAGAWFAETEGGALITSYEADQKRVYVVISDQQADPRRSYTALITNDRFGSDSETVVLRVHSPGILVADIAVSNATKTRRDGTLQVSVGGDQLQVEYVDPTYGERVVGRAGFDENVQEAALLEFTDESGTPLDAAAIWSPSKGKLHIRYSDDYAYGRVPTKAISLTLGSYRYGVLLGQDDDRFNASMASGSSGTRATWTGSIDLIDAFPAVDSNGRAETRFRGEATVTAFGHDNVGSATTVPVSDNLVIAYPDSTAILTWTLADTSKVPAGSDGLIIGIKDQDFTNGTDDSVLVSLICIRSGDSVSGVIAKETSPGNLTTPIVVRNGATPNPGDRILSCQSPDQVLVRYVDPVYGTTTQLVINEVATPKASPPGKNFIVEEFVTLTTATPGSVIHYTVDGSTPVPGVSPIYTDPIQIAGNTVLKAIAVVPGWIPSKVMVETYSKEVFSSRLEILDENGNNIPDGVLTGSATKVRFKVVTTQANLPPVTVLASTKVGLDAESVVLPNSSLSGNALEYWALAPLNHDNGTSVGNGTLDSRRTDTLIAVWTNPFNPSDVARDTIVIRPAFKVSEVYFTATPNGPAITSYADSQAVVYVTVKTSPKDASLVYRVTVSATELGLDDEVLTLTETTPGVFLAQVPVARGAKSPDVAGTLQVSAGVDQLSAVFVDPVFQQTYRGNAGFGQDVQESATLEFVRQDGTLVPPDEIWSPDLGKVYLRYSDDWLAGIDSLVHVRKAKITLINKKVGAVLGSDEEDVTLTLDSNTATRGVWLGSVQLRDRATAGAHNDTLESYYRGEAVASITPHTNKGIIGGADATDNLVIAYPNKPAEILIKDTAGTDVDRADPRIVITVRDQENTKTGDNTITVSVACEGTGDKLNSVKLTWNGTEYVSVPPIIKGEGDAKADSVLSCKSTDHIIVTFNDPVHPETKVADVRWSDQKVSKMYFASVKDSSAITSAADGVDNTVLVIVEGVSPTRDKADTIDVVLTTSQGEKLTVKAVETGALTGVFRAEVSYQFITKDPDPTDNKLEANINRDQRSNRVIVNADAVIAGDKLKAELALFSAYNMVVHAYIKDTDGNGRADKAYFVFDKKLARLPSSLEEVAWNEEGEKFRQKAGASMLSFLNSDSNVVVADFTKSQFGANLTGIPDGRKPYALFPSDNLFGGQLKLLADSVGPVPVTAVKFPSNLNSYSVSATEKRFYPDTMIITVSEPLKTTGSWDGLVRFSKGCAAYGESVPLRLSQAPVQDNSNPLQWTLIIDNSPQAQIPLVGDCIFLETDGRYSDLKGNRPSPLGVPITGENPKLVIRDFRGFPPVAGMDPGTPGFTLVTNDIKKDGSSTENRWSTQTGNGSWEVIWIPPVGFDECKGERDVLKCMQTKVPDGYDAKATPKRDIENQSLTPMPITSFSAVQVIATGRYIARVSIYDNFGVHVRSFVQAFGFWGEEKNPWRATDKGLRSFIVWDLKDKNGQMAGQGVYVWKVNFSFSDKKSEVMYTRTGVMRN